VRTSIRTQKGWEKLVIKYVLPRIPYNKFTALHITILAKGDGVDQNNGEDAMAILVDSISESVSAVGINFCEDFVATPVIPQIPTIRLRHFRQLPATLELW
jgi:hypothetical protein